MGNEGLTTRLQAESPSDVTANDLRVAATEIYSLALRRESRGTVKQPGVAFSEGWEPGGDDFGSPIHPPTLREALELFDIACTLQAEEYWIYTKGLLLMRMGDYHGAIRVFDGLAGDYANHGARMADQCRRKLAGSYDAKTEIAASFDEQVKRFEQRGINADHLRHVKETLLGALAIATQNRTSLSDNSMVADDDQVSRAAACAQQFTEHLVDRNFFAAKMLLARDLAAIDANQLKHSYERMIRLLHGENTGQVDVCVMSSERGMPGMKPEDLGWVYVAISGDTFSEAITVIVTLEDGDAKIRDIEWGRP